MLTRLLRRFLARYSRDLVWVVALQLVATLASLWLPRRFADIIDKGVARGDTGYVWSAGLVMLALTLVQVSFAVTAVYFGARTAMGFGSDVRSALFHRVMGYSTRELGAFGAPSLITRITNDVQQVQMLVLMTCTLFVAAPITAIGGLVMAVQVDPGLSLVLVVAIPALAVAISLVVVRMVPTFRLMQERIDAVNRVLREQIAGIRVVRAFVREPQERARFDRVNGDLTATSLRSGRLLAFMLPIVMGTINISSVAVVWFGAGRIENGSIRVGSLIAFLSYLTQILTAIMMATFMAMIVPRAAVSAERIQEVLDTSSSLVDAADPVTELPRGIGIELRSVGFHYPGAEAAVLDDISFSARPGETTAILGSTGAGKTTVINLIPRLFDVTAGSVLVGGVDVRDIAAATLRERIGLVPQKPYLFSGTVASNLRYGKPDATDDEIWDALEVAQAAEFVRAMGGLGAAIQQGGSNVSGGQRQRLAIARAIVHRPEIYLFDDAFSALDLATDAKLRAALAPRTRDAAVIIVAQRISTIIAADQIVVLDAGKLVGRGTHDELIGSCPTYIEIVESQRTAQAGRAA